MAVPPLDETKIREIVRSEMAQARVIAPEDLQQTLIWANNSRKAEAARRDRNRTSLAGLGYGMLGTITTGLMAWLLGGVTWLLHFSATK